MCQSVVFLNCEFNKLVKECSLLPSTCIWLVDRIHVISILLHNVRHGKQFLFKVFVLWLIIGAERCCCEYLILEVSTGQRKVNTGADFSS